MSVNKLLMFLGILVAILASLCDAKICVAQGIPSGCKYILDLIPPPADPNFKDQVGSFTDIAAHPECFWELASNGAPLTAEALQSAAVQSALAAQKRVNTTQTGSPTGSGGTTSATSKPVTPLSLATEYGGITSSTNAQTITLQAPLDGIPRALATHGIVPYCSSPLVSIANCVHRRALDDLNRIAVGAAMNTAAPSTKSSGAATGSAQGTTQPVSLTSLGNQSPSLASVFTKITILKGQAKLPDPATVNAAPAMAALAALKPYLDGNQDYDDWRFCVLEKLKTASLEDRVSVFKKYYVQAVSVLLQGASVSNDCPVNPSRNAVTVDQATRINQRKNFYSAVESYVAAAELLQANFDNQVNLAAASPVLSFEYDLNTPTSQPTNSTFKLVGSVGWPKPATTAKVNSSSSGASTTPWTLTYNFGASIYNATPASTIPGASVLRDIQCGAELDRNINSSKWPGLLGKIGDTTASLTYYLQYQSSPSILNVTPGSPLPGITITGLSPSAKQVFASKGTINVAQFKYAFGKGTNAKFPIAVTYSNRTELITHPTWGVQFGVTYDLSALMGTGSSK